MNDAAKEYADLQQKLLNETILLHSMKDAYEKVEQGLSAKANEHHYFEICIVLSVIGGALLSFILVLGDRNPVVRIALIIASCATFYYAHVYYARHQAVLADYVFHSYVYKRILRDSVSRIYSNELSERECQLRQQADAVTDRIVDRDVEDVTRDSLQLATLARSYLRSVRNRDEMLAKACDDFTIYCSVQDFI